MSPRIDETGKKYGRLLVLHTASNIGRRETRWVCRCDCGTQTVVRSRNLRHGRTRSCGCLYNEVVRGNFLKTVRQNAFDRFDEDIL